MPTVHRYTLEQILMTREVYVLDTLDHNERLPTELLQLLRDIEKRGEEVLSSSKCCVEDCAEYGGDSITVQFDTMAQDKPAIILNWAHCMHTDNAPRVAALRQAVRDMLPDWAQHFTISSM